MRLLQDRIAVKRSEAPTKSAGGIMLSAAPAPQNEGTVVAVGPGKRLENGTIVPMTVQVGDKVSFQAFAAQHVVKVNGEEFIVMAETEVLAIIED